MVSPIKVRKSLRIIQENTPMSPGENPQGKEEQYGKEASMVRSSYRLGLIDPGQPGALLGNLQIAGRGRPRVSRPLAGGPWVPFCFGSIAALFIARSKLSRAFQQLLL
jgi:hypothetical protein